MDKGKRQRVSDPRRFRAGDRSPQPFKRTTMRVPIQVRIAGRLWLDMFQTFGELLVGMAENAEQDAAALERARKLADRSLEIFQERWPEVIP